MSKKREVQVLDYSLCEELISAISHGVGAGLSVAAAVLCIVKAARMHDAWAVVSVCVFGLSLILLYTISCVYHSLGKKLKGKKVLRVIDHCMVFVLIAGSYTPFCFVPLRGVPGFVMFGIIWGLCAIGVTFNGIDVDKYQIVSAIVNILMGWAIVFEFGILLRTVGLPCVLWLLGGGIAYSVGAILYGVGSKVKYMHSVFHFFCLAGSILHFFAIYLYVLN